MYRRSKTGERSSSHSWKQVFLKTNLVVSPFFLCFFFAGFEAYLSEMAGEGVWGGEIEIRALSHALEVLFFFKLLFIYMIYDFWIEMHYCLRHTRSDGSWRRVQGIEPSSAYHLPQTLLCFRRTLQLCRTKHHRLERERERRNKEK